MRTKLKRKRNNKKRALHRATVREGRCLVETKLPQALNILSAFLIGDCAALVVEMLTPLPALPFIRELRQNVLMSQWTPDDVQWSMHCFSIWGHRLQPLSPGLLAYIQDCDSDEWKSVQGLD